MAEELVKVTVTFEKREDGGLRVWSEDVPGLVLSSRDVDAVLEDVKTALGVILSEKFGKTVNARPLVNIREILEDGGIVAPRRRSVEPGPREYVAFAS